MHQHLQGKRRRDLAHHVLHSMAKPMECAELARRVTFLSTTESVCPECLERIQAERIAEGERSSER